MLHYRYSLINRDGSKSRCHFWIDRDGKGMYFVRFARPTMYNSFQYADPPEFYLHKQALDKAEPIIAELQRKDEIAKQPWREHEFLMGG